MKRMRNSTGQKIVNAVELEKILKAFANRRRILILKYLKKESEATVSEIAGTIKLSFRATSQHLRILAGLDIIEREQRSLNAYYRLSKNQSAPIRSIISIL